MECFLWLVALLNPIPNLYMISFYERRIAVVILSLVIGLKSIGVIHSEYLFRCSILLKSIREKNSPYSTMGLMLSEYVRRGKKKEYI